MVETNEDRYMRQTFGEWHQEQTDRNRARISEARHGRLTQSPLYTFGKLLVEKLEGPVERTRNFVREKVTELYK